MGAKMGIGKWPRTPKVDRTYLLSRYMGYRDVDRLGRRRRTKHTKKVEQTAHKACKGKNRTRQNRNSRKIKKTDISVCLGQSNRVRIGQGQQIREKENRKDKKEPCH